MDPPRSHRADAAGRALLARRPQRPGQQRPYRREGDDDADGDRERQRHRKQRPVDGQRVFQAVGEGQPSDQGTEAGDGQSGPDGRSEHRHDHRLGDDLADQPPAAGAKGGAQRQFLAAIGGAGQYQRGDVGAGDRQDQQHRRLQQQHRRAHGTNQVVAQRPH